MASSVLLNAHNVYKIFIAGDTRATVLEDITISFDSAHTYALTGRSGSGKSTLVHLLAGLDVPSRGTVVFNNNDINTLPKHDKQTYLRTHIGLMFQQPYLIPELSVIENSMLPGLIDKKDLNNCTKQAELLLDYIGLADKKDCSVGSLSGGQQQRVALARALFNKPRFLIADEPTGNLDQTTASQIVELLLACHHEWGMGIIISTHDEYVAQKMQILYHLDNGHISRIDNSPKPLPHSRE